MAFGDWEINLKGNIFDKTDRDFFVVILGQAHTWGFTKYVSSVGVVPTPSWAETLKPPKKEGEKN